MHNERVRPTKNTTLPIRSLTLAAASALVLAGCGSGGDEASQTPSSTVSVSPSPSSTVSVPAGAELTEIGADLAFGDTATVIYEPNQKKGTVLDLTVESARRGSTKDFSGFILDEAARASTPYYVDVKVKNTGEGELGGTPVPLWGVDDRNTLLPPAAFTTTFPTCASKPLPDELEPGSSFSTCLVFLAPDRGTMTAVSFRPNQDFDPIEWTGDIATPKPEPKKDTKKDTKKPDVQKQGEKQR